MKKNKFAPTPAEFWVTNHSNMNVCLSDLALTIPAGRTMNLLDKKHFKYTLEQLNISSNNGSLFKKKNKIIIRSTPPKVGITPGIYLSKEPRYIAPRSSVKIEEKIYKEFLSEEDQLISEEKFAEEWSDKPIWNIKK